MKHKGAIAEFSQERIKELMREYRDYLILSSHVNVAKMYNDIANMPAKRFWVSDIWASKIVSAMLRGCPYNKMRPLKKEMFQEIYKRVLNLKTQNPEYSISKCCKIVVEQPAPKHYISAGSIRVMICKERRRRREEQLKRKLE